MKRIRKSRFWINWIYLILIIACIFSNVFYEDLGNLLLLYPDYNYSNSTEIHFIDVGQGDAIAIKFKNGETMLIDSGLESYRSKLFSYLDNIVLEGKNTIDYLVLTHIDTDHSGNILSLMKRYNIKTFYRPPVKSILEGGDTINTNHAYNSIINYANDNNINMKSNIAGLNLSIDDCLFEWLAPIDIEYKVDMDSNNYSPIIKMTSGDYSALFTGDIDSQIEIETINHYGDKLDIDILKVAHHGSNSSTSDAFLNVSSPDYAVISVGENLYGHPSNKLLKRILEYDKENRSSLYKNIHTTYDEGNIYITISDKIKFNNIKNIDDYVYIDYYVYSIIAVIFLIVLMLMPYYFDIRKGIIFYFRNKNWKKQQMKNINDLDTK